MDTLTQIAKDPYRRPPSMYNYKVRKLNGNQVTFVDASRKEFCIDFENDSPDTLEMQYGADVDNLFIAVSYTNTYFFYRKLSNDRPWRA